MTHAFRNTEPIDKSKNCVQRNGRVCWESIWLNVWDNGQYVSRDSKYRLL